MKITQVKAISWLMAAGLTAALGWYVFDFVSTLKERQSRFDVDAARAALNSVEKPQGPKIDLVSVESVESAFYDLNWTGEPPPPPPVEVAPAQAEGPQYTPVGSILKLLYIQQDFDHPERSQTFVRYLDDSDEEPPQTGSNLARVPGVFLRVGDRLAEPHQDVRVLAIDAFAGVTFAFDDEEREHETLTPQSFDTKMQIVQVGEDGIIRAQRTPIPKADERAAWVYQERTQLIGRDHYAIGTEDQFRFAEDYPTILADEIRSRSHIDPKTGRRDGIELTEVKPGGMAARHGAQSGDIIKSINGERVNSTAEAITYVKHNKDKYDHWTVVIENKGRERTVVYDSPPQD